MEIVIILLLIAANGIFAMAEIAVVSSRKARLNQMAENGRKSAATALSLAENPNDFLSTVQVGITLIGTLAGAFGGATLAEKITPYFAAIPAVAEYAGAISLTLVVMLITYLSLIIGELTPKRLALSNPEGIAVALAGPMRTLSRLTHPVVRFLSWSTDVMMKLIPLRKSTEAVVTEEEVRFLVEQGAQAGAFQPAERTLIEGVFRLADRRILELMRPRRNVVWIDLNADAESVAGILAKHPHSRFPVCRGTLDEVAGIIYVKDLYVQQAKLHTFDIEALLQKPLYIPEGTNALRVLELFQTSGMHFGFVINEHGGVEGIVTITDLMQAIVGRLPDPGQQVEPPYVQRPDGSWLVDGAVTLADLKEVLAIRQLPREEEGVFNTIGGFVMTSLGRVPHKGDRVQADSWEFEVMDMDGNRVDEVLVSGPGNGKEPDAILD